MIPGCPLKIVNKCSVFRGADGGRAGEHLPLRHASADQQGDIGVRGQDLLERGGSVFFCLFNNIQYNNNIYSIYYYYSIYY